MLDFRSDNTAPAAPEMLEALRAANEGMTPSYGGDDWTRRLQERASAVFEAPVRVYPVASGTAANALSLAAAAGTFGSVYCTPDAHIHLSEWNATGFLGGGTKMMPVGTPGAKLQAAQLEAALADAAGWPHKARAAVVNLVQATEMGQVYTPQEVAAIAQVAHARGLKVHMDGARFANAVAHLGCTPAELTVQAGVDILSFGVTKNGGLNADAIVVFTPSAAEELELHLMRAGLVWSKMRYASAQVLAYLENGLWLRLARQANEAALHLAAQAAEVAGVRVVEQVQANEVFLRMPATALDRLREGGVNYARRGGELARFVCRWDTTRAEVDALLAAIQAASVS